MGRCRRWDKFVEELVARWLGHIRRVLQSNVEFFNLMNPLQYSDGLSAPARWCGVKTADG